MREGWVEKKLEDLADEKKAIVSGPFGSNLKVSDYRDSGIPIIRLQNVGKGYFIEKDIKYIDKEKAEELKSHSFVVGDIVLAKLGIPIGKTCIIPDSFSDGIILADIVRIRPDRKRVDYNFLEYFLNTSLSVSQLTKNISGATRPRVNLSNVRSIVVPIPPLPEQKQIVKTLDLAFGQIDQAKANLEQNLANAKALFASKLNEVFSQRGEGWEEKRLGDVCNFVQGIQRGVKLQNELKGENQVRFLRIVDYTQGSELPRYIDFPGEKYILNEDDIAIVRYGASTGFVCRGLVGALANNLFRIIPKKTTKLRNDFLFLFLSSSHFQNIIKLRMNGAAMPAISFGMIEDIPIYEVEIEEQIEIVKNMNKLDIEFQTLQTHYQQNLNNLEELKKSILEKAFKGEL